jgi:hypothetical protein
MDVLKNDFREFDEGLFQSVESKCELIFWMLGIVKGEKRGRLSVLNVGEWHWEHIICLLEVLKNDFRKVDETIFQRIDRPCELIFYILGIEKKPSGRSCLREILSRQMALWSYILTSGSLKNRLCWTRWSDFSRCRKAVRPHFIHPEHRKKRLGWSSLSDFLIRPMAVRIHNVPSKCLKMRFWWCSFKVS